MSEQRLLSQGTDQSFGVHLAQPQDVERTAIYRGQNTHIYITNQCVYIAAGSSGYMEKFRLVFLDKLKPLGECVCVCVYSVRPSLTL